jgi:hypothetical protein
VRLMLNAAIHSRAAYGYAMAAGHISSLLNFARLVTINQLRCDLPLRPLTNRVHLVQFGRQIFGHLVPVWQP